MSYQDSSNFLDQFKDQVRATDQTQQDSQQPSGDQSGYNYDYSQYYNQGYYAGYGGYDYSQYQQQSGANSSAPSSTNPTDASGQQNYGYDTSAYGSYPSSYPGFFPPMFPGMTGMYTPPPPKPQQGEPSRSLWLGNLHPDTTDSELHGTFGRFGLIESIKIVPGKNCAFVKYLELDAAIQAFNQMQRCVIHGQLVKVGWGKTDAIKKDEDTGAPPSKNLWVGGIPADTTEEQIRGVFGRYGVIDKVRILGPKNCCFVNFTSIENSTNAKRELSGTLFGDRPLKINYGREAPPGKFGMDLFGLAPESPKEPEIDPPPPDAVAPPEEMKVVIDKMADFVNKNGLAFEMTLKEKQKDNPKFGFINDGHPYNGYYRLRIWCLAHPGIDPHVVRAKQMAKDMQTKTSDSHNVPPPYGIPPPSSYGTSQSAPTPVLDEDMLEFKKLLDSVDGSKDSIKHAKNWIITNPQLLAPTAVFLNDYVAENIGFERKLNILYVIHDVLYHALKHRPKSDHSDEYSDAFATQLGSILKSCYQGYDPRDQDKVKKVVHLWEDKRVYDTSTVKRFEDEMRGRSDRHGKDREDRSDRNDRSERRDRSSEKDRDDRKRRDRDYDREDRSGDRKRRY